MSPSDALCTFKFPRSARILSNAQYKALRYKGSRFLGQHISIEYRPGRLPHSRPRLGITVSRKFGKAHDRNRFKRCVREAFRELQYQFPLPLDMNVFPGKKPFEISKLAILVDLKQFISQK